MILLITLMMIIILIMIRIMIMIMIIIMITMMVIVTMMVIRISGRPGVTVAMLHLHDATAWDDWQDPRSRRC